MAYSGVYVFGDSLVDAGNALKLAETYDSFPFASLPDGAPTEEKGYHSGNFTNGWTLVDLISNKHLSVTTKSIFPFGFNDPIGIHSDPSGNNLNFAYGGAQLRQGDEAVPDIDDQTDAFRDAVDGDADPNALYIFSFGANDVHDLISRTGGWESLSTAEAVLSDAAGELIEEIMQTVDIGARHIVVVGVPDIGIQPIFSGTPDEAARRAVATEYADLLDQMIQDRLAALDLPDGVEIHYISWDAMQAQVIGTMADLYGDAAIYPLEDSGLVFFDQVHPTAQVHALGAAYMIDQLNGASAGEWMPLTAPDYSAVGSIAAKGEADNLIVSLAANTSYTFNLLGISTLGGNVSVLADPMLKIFGPGGTLAGSNDDGGLGLDASLTFTSGAAGDYTIQLSGVGILTGSYSFQAAGQATGNNSYSVSHGGAIILERAGGGFDTVAASVSYALNPDAEVEVLRTASDKGKTAINLTGNDYGQTIVGNAGNNILEGKGGADTLTGGGGKDVFVLSNAALTSPGTANIDVIADYGSGDVVDIRQILSVAAGTDVVAGQYLRVTTSGLVQVDVDGGGDNWITLSTINNGGAVSLRYLSGGTPTTVSVSRTSANSNLALASAVAASGLMANSTVAETVSIGQGDLLVAAAMNGGDAGLAARHDATVRSALSGETREMAYDGPEAGPMQDNALASPGDMGAQGLTPPEVGSANIPSGLLAGTDAPGHANAAAMPSLTAHAVAMPPAELMLMVHGGAGNAPLAKDVAQVVADALGIHSPMIDALLESLPHSASSPIAALEQITLPNSWDAPAAGVLSAAFQNGDYHPDALMLA